MKKELTLMEPKKINKKNTELQKEHFKIIGGRLRELRKGLKISIYGLEAELDLPSGAVFNLEIGKGGNTLSFITIITFFFNKGYSYKWILNYANDVDFKKDEVPFLLGLDKPLLLELGEELKEKTNKILEVFGEYVEIQKI